jgi:Zn finger protein HypA/HybF involved in hydrogenase expression
MNNVRRRFLLSGGYLPLMCATCGCGIDLGGIEEVFAKNYRCQDCSLVFKGFGYKVACPRCKSTNTKRTN